MTLRDIRIARWLGRQGFRHPYRQVRAARKVGIKIATSCALLSMETGNGKNVYGHDPVSTHGCYAKGGAVTKSNYRCYKRWRGSTGRGGMQGVGPTQLTWYSYQDQADKLGGCWNPYYNMFVGFRLLRDHFRRTNSLWRAFHDYNGSGSAAVDYANRAIALRKQWQAKLRRAGF